MWLFMCTSEEGHIRVSTLQNHLKQNNDFTKLFFTELHLSEHQQLSFTFRFLRFLFAILVLYTVNSYIITITLSSSSDTHVRRKRCEDTCENIHFPSDSACSPVDDVTIVFKQQLYNRFFRFSRPHPENITRDQLEGYRTCQSYAESPSEFLWINYYSYYATLGLSDRSYLSSNQSAFCERYNGSKYCDQEEGRLHSCFFSCRRSEDTLENGYLLDNRPHCDDLKKKGQTKELLCLYHHDFGIAYLLSSPVVMCLAHPSMSLQTEIMSSMFEAALTSGNVDQQVAVETVKEHGLFYHPDVDPLYVMCFSLYHVFIAILITNPLQIVSEYLMYFITGTPDEMFREYYSPKWKKCTAILFLAFLLTVMTFLNCYSYFVFIRFSCFEVVVWTFSISLLLDQAKNLVVQPAIWYLFIVRCGRISPGPQEYISNDFSQHELKPSFLSEIRSHLVNFLESAPVQKLVLGILVAYFVLMVFIFLCVDERTRLQFGTLPNVEQINSICQTIDLGFLMFFLAELMLKTFSFGTSYFKDALQFMDAAIVIASFAMDVTGLCILRIFIQSRAVTIIMEDRKKIRPSVKQYNNMGFRVGSKFESVLEMIKELQRKTNIAPALRDDLDWVVDVIVSEKLHEVPLQREAPGENSSYDNELDSGFETFITQNKKIQRVLSSVISKRSSLFNWSSRSSESRSSSENRKNRSSVWSIEDMYKLALISGSSPFHRYSRRRRNSSHDRGKSSNSLRVVDDMYRLALISPQDASKIEEVMRNFDEWQFDVFMASEFCEDNLLPIVFFRAVSQYDILNKYKLNFEKMLNFLKNVQNSFPKTVCFHGATHTADVIQCVHYFFSRGRLAERVGDFEVFMGLFGALVCNYGHPGVTSDFLISHRHPAAIRYNDQSIVENFSASAVSKLLRDPELNFLGKLDQYNSCIRMILVELLLNMDMTRLTSDLAIFRTTATSEFPGNNPTERKLFLSITLRAADLSFPARPRPLYFRWMDKMMEEFFRQGDVEKQIGHFLTPFCDRDRTNMLKVQLGFVQVIVQPLLSTFVIVMMPKSIQKELLEECLEGNKKILQIRTKESQVNDKKAN